ncbi:class I SAM-dependent methyltransferase [Vitreoscilla massiliensis]|uniref:Class I SAM-dependent methyltransferase n=1 Tax=Vitreoscilla massiliensis TaxID=1689272 RepID=A0ABY4DYB8_9NEIS|nr:class I SAM-dependent methyltransferase [Vitreoscilla massiliensis]UOO88525.1 class I SAM-dependent methyltransferase [Vitreoscilla massiliensis]
MLLPDDQPKFDLHPDRLRALAILLNLPTPAKVDGASILFLGVSLGANLLALASEYPKAKFTAVCLNSNDASQLQAAYTHLGLNNIQWHLQDGWFASDATPRFDYILCHGYYSYLTDEAKQTLLQNIRHSLNDNGLAYVDYLIEPGWQAFTTLQHLIVNTCDFANKPSLEEINRGINLVYASLPAHSPLKASIEHIVPRMDMRHHPDLNGYWPLLPAFADTTEQFISRLHQADLGYVCDSDLTRYYFDSLSEALLQLSGHDIHLRENLYDLVHQQASRASFILPIDTLLGFRIPTQQDLSTRIGSLHITGHFDLNADKSAWMNVDVAGITIVASPFNNMLVDSINRVYAADSTLSVSKLLEVISTKFKHVADIDLHAQKLLTDMILSGMVQVRSQRHNGFLHRNKMLSLHRWRMQHNPYLTPANKWLQPWSEQDIQAQLDSNRAASIPD